MRIPGVRVLQIRSQEVVKLSKMARKSSSASTATSIGQKQHEACAAEK